MVLPSIRARSPLRFRRTDRLMKALFSPLIDRVLVLVRSLGPYAAIELLLPGGSMIALLYWWYRHRTARPRRPRRPLSPSAVLICPAYGAWETEAGVTRCVDSVHTARARIQ